VHERESQIYILAEGGEVTERRPHPWAARGGRAAPRSAR